jgi:hypothetical protein
LLYSSFVCLGCYAYAYGFCQHFHCSLHRFSTGDLFWSLNTYFLLMYVLVDAFSCCILLLCCSLFVDIRHRIIYHGLYGIASLGLWFCSVFRMEVLVLLCEASCSVLWWFVVVARQDFTNYSSDRPEDGRRTTETCSHRRLTTWFQVIII